MQWTMLTLLLFYSFFSITQRIGEMKNFSNLTNYWISKHSNFSQW